MIRLHSILDVKNNWLTPKKVEKELKKIEKEFGSYKICPQHGEVITRWRYYQVNKQKCADKYICIECEHYKNTHHTKFPKRNPK